MYDLEFSPKPESELIDLLEEGTCHFKVVNAEKATSKSSGAPMIKLTLEVHDKNNNSALIVVGQTFDCYKKLDYLFDLVVEVQKKGTKRIGVIKKSRLESFPDTETFDFCYENIAKKYGIELIERKSIKESLANEGQISEIKRLIDLLKISPEIYEKWISKGEATCFEEMREPDIQKCIDFINLKMKGE